MPASAMIAAWWWSGVRQPPKHERAGLRLQRFMEIWEIGIG